MLEALRDRSNQKGQVSESPAAELDSPADELFRRSGNHKRIIANPSCAWRRPFGSKEFPGDILERLRLMATDDPSAKVRTQASWALACRCN